MYKPFFSIIIPVYNTEGTLPRSLDSILFQTFESKNLEVVVVNDGSPNEDACDNVINSYKDRLNINYVVFEENKGLYLARKTGVQQATGEYLLHLDSDDFMESNALKILYEDIQSNGDVDYIEFNYYNLLNRTKSKNVPLSSYKILEDNGLVWSLNDYHTIWNKCFASIFAKRAYECMADFYSYYNEDYYQMGIIRTLVKTTRTIERPLFVYVTDGGITKVKKYEKVKLKRIILSIYNVDKYLTLFYKENGSDAYVKFIEEYSESLYIFCMRHSNPQDFIEVLNERLDRTLIRRLMFKYLLEIKRNVVAHQNYEKCFILLRKIVGDSTHPKCMPNKSLCSLLNEYDSLEELTNAIGKKFTDEEVTNFFFNYVSWAEERLFFYKKHAKLVSFIKTILRPFWRFYKFVLRK